MCMYMYAMCAQAPTAGTPVDTGDYFGQLVEVACNSRCNG